MKTHRKFISLPISSVLDDVKTASKGIDFGIEGYPLCDYIMQSVFIKMTGFQEQKMKCICWELATHDYDYRYHRFSKEKLGECSKYDEKTKIYSDLIGQIKKYRSDFSIINESDREVILKKSSSEVEEIFSDSNLSIWAQRKYFDYEKIWERIGNGHFASDGKNLLKFMDSGVCLRKVYTNHLYRHRNRIAHNTQSYQHNLPTLKTLAETDFLYENYFVWFALLNLIDKIVIHLYSIYIECLEKDI